MLLPWHRKSANDVKLGAWGGGPNMRHLTWAVTWMIVGLAVTLATASVIQQQAMIRVASQQPAPAIMPDAPAPADTVRPKTNEPARSLVVASRRRHEPVN